MKYNMKKVIIVISFIFLISGCSDNSSISNLNTSASTMTDIITSPENSDNASLSLSDTSNSISTSDIVSENKINKIYSSSEIYNIRKDKEDDIAKKTLEEYKNAMMRLQKQFSFYDLTIASIKKNMIENFWYEDNAFDWQQNTQDAIKCIDNMPEYSPIYSGLSLDDILFVALSQPISEESQKYTDVVNKISNSQNEMDFLKGFNNIANSKGYYALDIYVYDLLSLNRKISTDGIKFTSDGSININDNQMENLSMSPNDGDLENYLKKYKREVNYSKEFKNKEWNLFLFEKREMQPFSILISCKTCDNQLVDLRNITSKITETEKNIENINKSASALVNSERDYSGIYFYDYEKDTRDLIEDNYIIIEKINGKLVGRYYGISDDFDEAREGYYPGFFVANMLNLKITNNVLTFNIELKPSDLFSKPVNLKYKSSQEVRLSENPIWVNSHIVEGSEKNPQNYR